MQASIPAGPRQDRRRRRPPSPRASKRRQLARRSRSFSVSSIEITRPSAGSSDTSAFKSVVIAGLVLEVKGDYCEQVRGILSDAGRVDAYPLDIVDADVACRHRPTRSAFR